MCNLFGFISLQKPLMVTGMPANIFSSATFQFEKAQHQPAN